MSKYRSLSLALILSGLLTGCGSITGLQDAESNFACSVDMTPRCASLSAVHNSLDNDSLLVSVIATICRCTSL